MHPEFPHFSHAMPWSVTGQMECYDGKGAQIPCTGAGQDATRQTGARWPAPRFQSGANTFIDLLTGLEWWGDANRAGFPMRWDEALDYIVEMNATREGGHADWRLPNRREMRSLIDYGQHRPALPPDIPARGIFQSWYWTSTTAVIHPNHAWYVDLAGGRVFYGGKDQSYMVWPVRGSETCLARTGQIRCFDWLGAIIPCEGTGQDGAILAGFPARTPRFVSQPDGVLDQLTELIWYSQSSLGGLMNWEEALACVQELNEKAPLESHWRLPNINELESLVDCDQHDPALPKGHPFSKTSDIYWSSTTSVYEPDWAWALYLEKGALGVGHKPFARFSVWPVRRGWTPASL